MKIVAKHEYPCSSAELYQLFTRDGFHSDKFSACGARNIEVLESEKTDDTFSITLDREVPADVPGVLKSLIGEWNTVTQTEEWEDVGDAEFICDFALSTEGVPAEISGTMNVMPHGDGCVNHVEMEITSSVPLLGKKLAQFIGKDAEKTLGKEYEYISSVVS
ncbi:MAG: DUF2505 domain-containing protein [Gammaproteobacteria bacterium]